MPNRSMRSRAGVMNASILLSAIRKIWRSNGLGRPQNQSTRSVMASLRGSTSTGSAAALMNHHLQRLFLAKVVVLVERNAVVALDGRDRPYGPAVSVALLGNFLALERQHLAVRDQQVALGAGQRHVGAKREGAELRVVADQRSPVELAAHNNRLRIRAHGQTGGIGSVLEAE